MDAPPDLKGRPIVAGTNFATSRLSELLDKILSPLVKHLNSYIKDDWHFLAKLPREINYECELYSFDIVSLYTSIGHDLGITAIKYWINKYRSEIPERFTNSFIEEACLFILENNYFKFDVYTWLQLVGTAMGTNFAPPYACLSIGYLEETKLYPELELHYTKEYCDMIKTFFLRFMDDCFTPWPKIISVSTFKEILNNLDDEIRFTIEPAVHYQKEGQNHQKLNFLDVMIILHENGKIETDIYYKDTNTHDYLHYDSDHPTHVKDNIPFTLAKKIIVFCSSDDTERKRLKDMKEHLIESKYPINIIERGFRNARLQGPANKPKNKNITFITRYAANYDARHVTQRAQKLLNECRNDKLKDIFKDAKVTLALQQPPNILRLLTSASFNPNNEIKLPNGFYKCNNIRCLICQRYLQECTYFYTSNNTRWEIKEYINCHAKCTLYYLKCLICNRVTYTGKTNILRPRINNHISDCRTGNSTDRFDIHVYNCRRKHNCTQEPYFALYAFMTVPHEKMLLTYENYLHNKGFDTMN